MRFHVTVLPRTQSSQKHDACAFTAKVYQFLKMMHDLGHEVYHYGAEGSEVGERCTEHIPVISAAEQKQFFGPFDQNKLYDLDWSGKAPYWKLINLRAAQEINKRKQRGDFLCLIAGNLNDFVVQSVGKDVIPVEYGIGYDGPYYPFRVYESYSLMHRVWGSQNFNADGSFYQAVIPNYWELDAFPLQPMKQDYYLYLGRLIKRKGINIAVETCKAIGAKLVVAGQGCVKVEKTVKFIVRTASCTKATTWIKWASPQAKTGHNFISQLAPHLSSARLSNPSLRRRRLSRRCFDGLHGKK